MASYNYTLDDAGYREQVVEKDGNRIEWEYDNLYRLTSEKRYGIDGSTLLQTTGFTYDLANNRQTMTADGQTTTYHYNNLDQITYIDHPTGPNTTYTYNGRGNLAEVFDGTNSTFYGYDALDRLEEVILPTGSVYYDYDADGRRVKQTVGATVTNYLWDEFSAYGDVVMESDGSSSILASYTLAEGQLIAQTRGGNKSYYLKDGQGSIRTLTNASGGITDTYGYNAFGDTYAAQTVGTTINTYRYTGQQFDTLTELYSLRARYYEPANGRFLSRDTYAYDYYYPVELNRYVYATDNPVNFNDPTGLFIMVQQAQTTSLISLQSIARLALVAAGVTCAISFTLTALNFLGPNSEWMELVPPGCEAHQMTVQLQVGSDNYSKAVVNLPASGVTTVQIDRAFMYIYLNYMVESTLFPGNNTFRREVGSAVIKMSKWVHKQPLFGGVTQTGNIHREPIKGYRHRLDLENKRGHNLRV